jgi:aspartate racemase
MKKIGMIGGFGPESTLDYYRLIIETYRKETNGESYPEIIIYSMDMNKLMKLVSNKEWNTLVDWLVSGIEVLHKGGADFAFISANTPHIVFDRVNKLSPIPLISIIEATSEYIKIQGIKEVGLLGTKFTMESNFYQEVFKKNDIQIIMPNEEERNYIHKKLMTEIELGNFLDETRTGLLEIIKRMINDNSIDGIILGCTELPLILTKSEFGVPFFNTTKIHVESIVKYYLNMII